jgi:hypothetical protein
MGELDEVLARIALARDLEINQNPGTWARVVAELLNIQELTARAVLSQGEEEKGG